MPELTITPGTYRTRDGSAAVVCGVCNGPTDEGSCVIGFIRDREGYWRNDTWCANGNWLPDSREDESDLVERISDSVSFDPPKRIRPWTPEELVERIRQVGGPLLVKDKTDTFHIHGVYFPATEWFAFCGMSRTGGDRIHTLGYLAACCKHVSDGSPCGVEEESWS